MRGKHNYQGKCCTDVQYMVIEQHVRKKNSEADRRKGTKKLCPAIGIMKESNKVTV